MGPNHLSTHTPTLPTPHSSTMDKLKGMASKLGSGSGGSNTAGSSDPNAANTAGQSTNQGDALDKGVGMAGKQFGHNLDRQQQEKVSDGLRSGYTKATGSDVPIKDQN